MKDFWNFVNIHSYFGKEIGYIFLYGLAITILIKAVLNIVSAIFDLRGYKWKTPYITLLGLKINNIHTKNHKSPSRCLAVIVREAVTDRQDIHNMLKAWPKTKTSRRLISNRRIRYSELLLWVFNFAVKSNTVLQISAIDNSYLKLYSTDTRYSFHKLQKQ